MPKKEVVLKTLKNVFFYYTQVAEPVLRKEAKDKGIKQDPENPSKNSEYVVKIVVPEDYYSKMRKSFKGVSNFKEAKEFTIGEFEEAFHKEGGMPNFGDDVEDVVMIKFAQKAQSASGKDMRAPKVIAIKKTKRGEDFIYKDNSGEVIEQSTLLGNGTKGHLQIRPVEFADYSPYLYPHAICVTDLVHYEAGEGTEVDEDGFGIEEEEDEVGDSESFDDDFDDIPF